MCKKVLPWAVGAGLAGASFGAMAQSAVDVSSVVTGIGAQATPIGLIGGAVLLLIVGIKAYKWVRRAM